jgi:hypothetical protein
MVSEAVQRILVADDHADILEAVSLLCTALGFDVRTANSGSAALVVVAEYDPGDWRQLLLPVGDNYSCRSDGLFTRDGSRWGSCRRGVM